MTVNSCLDSVSHLSLALANVRMEEFCGISCFFDGTNDFRTILSDDCLLQERKDEYGDWQTNMDLALAICRLMKKQGVSPRVLIEPTCGKGHFILAALQTFDSIEEIYGIEIYKPYLDCLKLSILQYFLDNPSARKIKINLYHQNVFDFDFASIKKLINSREVLVVGNPPWVTNSTLGEKHSDNLPPKTNFKKKKGLDAITGKGNFDIAEYICLQMIDFLIGEKANLALLVKNSVAKNIVYEQRRVRFPINVIEQYNIDAKKEFNVSVAASLLCMNLGEEISLRCQVRDFYSLRLVQEYGWVDNCFVADTHAYNQHRYMDGKSTLTWWSGVKHDCAKIMELVLDKGRYLNGLGQVVDIEEERVYPLLKSSDITNDVLTSTRKYVIITQKTPSDDTKWLAKACPKTYQYLMEHAAFLDERGSSIYHKRPRFCLFGIGDYSFKKYKVVVSGLYKHVHFSLVKPINGKPVMLDDTCYSLGFDEYENALVAQRILNCPEVQSFMRSLLFLDSKRVVNKDLLMRIDWLNIIGHIRKENVGVSAVAWDKFVSYLSKSVSPKQFYLFS